VIQKLHIFVFRCVPSVERSLLTLARDGAKTATCSPDKLDANNMYCCNSNTGFKISFNIIILNSNNNIQNDKSVLSYILNLLCYFIYATLLINQYVSR